jgi:hypothetical protein
MEMSAYLSVVIVLGKLETKACYKSHKEYD